MKTIIVRGGLGNQIFEYAFSLYLKEKTNSPIKYLRRKRGKLRPVEAMELPWVFDINIETQGWIEKNKYKFYKHFDKKKITTENNFSLENNFFDDSWQNLKFFKDFPANWIRFRKFDLSDKNNEIIAEIESKNSVAIHIRRGNYLNKRNIGLYGDVCTKEYYQKAMELVEKQIPDPTYFICSNDIEWVQENFNLKNARIISWNQGGDSYLDMYLMSKCDACIIANSTFSYWSAYLEKPKKIVVYPKVWFNPQAQVGVPDIFPETWVGI